MQVPERWQPDCSCFARCSLGDSSATPQELVSCPLGAGRSKKAPPEVPQGLHASLPPALRPDAW